MENLQSRPGRLATWYLAARPKTLPAAAAPVIIGSAMAYGTGRFHLGASMAALAGALLIQIGTNFANDLFDYLHETDTEERLGPERATQSGWVTPSRMKTATVFAFGLAALVGAYLVHRGGIPILTIGVASILLGIFYTAGPLPLGHIGLGDILVLTFFGPVAVGGTYYVVTLGFHPGVLPAGLACGMLSTAVLTVNNLRDIDSDRRSGKRTLAVRFGASFARREYMLMTVGGILTAVPSAVLFPAHPWVLISLLTIVFALRPIRQVRGGLSGPALNAVLASTGRTLSVFSILFSVGWLL